MVYTKLSIITAAVLGVTLAATVSYSLVVNGQVAADKAIVVNGKTHVPLGVLESLGVSYSLKGTTLTLGSQTQAAQAPNQTPGRANP